MDEDLAEAAGEGLVGAERRAPGRPFDCAQGRRKKTTQCSFSASRISVTVPSSSSCATSTPEISVPPAPESRRISSRVLRMIDTPFHGDDRRKLGSLAGDGRFTGCPARIMDRTAPGVAGFRARGEERAQASSANRKLHVEPRLAKAADQMLAIFGAQFPQFAQRQRHVNAEGLAETLH